MRMLSKIIIKYTNVNEKKRSLSIMSHDPDQNMVPEPLRGKRRGKIG